MLERQLRIGSGLVMACFVTLHLLNHALGVVSLDVMDDMRRPLSAWWRSYPGTLLLYGAFLTHFALALVSVYRRRSLAMPVWEAAQALLGLLFVVLVAKHATAARGLDTLLGLEVGYEYVLTAIWLDDRSVWQQPLLLLAAWLHLCVGLHFWLRLRSWYPRVLPSLFALALLVPALSLAGYVAAGLDVLDRVAADPRFTDRLFEGFRAADPQRRALLLAGENIVLALVGICLGTVLLARVVRDLAARRSTWRVRIGADRQISGSRGQTLLEALRVARVPHASVCGGRARCTTCRVRVGDGIAQLDPPGEEEARALERIGAAANVRLACQLRPRAALAVTALLAPDASAADARRTGGVAGREQVVTVLFIDLRGSTRLGETRLPYDVLFLLNRFFTEMSAALVESNGHYAQFNGDGLMALYGLDGDVTRGCRDALRGAARMSARLQHLNQSLVEELPAALRIGIGVHCGEAIVGTMGPPSSPILSAIGDNVNIAARLESHTKQLDCTLVISESVATSAGLELEGLRREEAEVRGRNGRIGVYAVQDPESLLPRLPDTTATAR